MARCRVEILPNGTSSNQAEYVALITGMFKARDEGMRRLRVKGDSQLVINQMTGVFNVRSNNISALHEYATDTKNEAFQLVTFDLIPRAQNSEPDALASEAIDGNCDKQYDLQLDKWPPLKRRK